MPTFKESNFATLPIADASSLPKTPIGNARAPCVVIGERVANLVKDSYAGRRPRR